MKIVGIRTQRLVCPLDPPFHAAWDPVPRRAFEATLVLVDTDEGITGLGSGDSMEGFSAFEHLFIGQDPTHIVRHVRTLETINFHAGRYWPLEAALWDIVGQVTGQPVANLFGASTDRLPVYASCGELKTPEERAESALAMREAGFRALKIRIDRDRVAEGISAVAAVRQAVASSMEIMVDMNQAWRMSGDIAPATDPATARHTAEALRELGVLWMEEPLPGSDLRGLASLRSTTGIRVAGGEMVRTLHELLAYVEADAFDVYQPDVVLAVGMHRARLIGELALVRNRWFTPHTWTNGIGLLANLHVAAGVGGGPFLEFPYDPPGWTPERRDFMLAEALQIDGDGCLVVPRRAGLGASIDPDALRKYSVD